MKNESSPIGMGENGTEKCPISHKCLMGKSFFQISHEAILTSSDCERTA